MYSFTAHHASMHRPLLTALGSGGLARLQYLRLRGSPQWGGPGAQATIASGSLPALRTLELDFPDSGDGLVAALLGAAGPRLETLSAYPHPSTSAAFMRTLAERDFPWLRGLQQLQLNWFNAAPQDWTKDTPSQIVAVLSRAPSLMSASIFTKLDVEELIVRLLVLLEGGGLARLTDITLMSLEPVDRERGAALLLLLWLKRQATKALRGKERGPVPGAKLDVAGLFMRSGAWLGTWMDRWFEKLEQAHERM